MRRVVSTLVALLAVGCTALSSAAALKIPASDEKIILTTASGEEKIVTRAEMEAIESQQRQLHAQLLDRVEGEWVEDESLSDVARRDPLLARSIVIARDSFDVLQQHGYARGYTLSSFTEVDEIPITSQRAQKDPDFNGRIELRITLQLRATLDPQSGVQANSGTSAAKRGAAPQTLGYEVEVLFDKHGAYSKGLMLRSGVLTGGLCSCLKRSQVSCTHGSSRRTIAVARSSASRPQRRSRSGTKSASELMEDSDMQRGCSRAASFWSWPVVPF
jgi:hypothetical protein